MNPSELVNYIGNPALLGTDSIFDLTLTAEQYPFFQAIQLLRVKNIYNIAPETIKPALNYTAAFITDRKLLYYLLHPIDVGPVAEKSKFPEKQIKDTIRENIADTLEYQKLYAESNIGEEIEFTTSFDLRKEYGQGVKLDEFVVRMNNSEKDSFELLSEKREPAKKAFESLADEAETKDIKPVEDVLSLINKNFIPEDISSANSELSQEKLKRNSLIDNFLKINPKIVAVKLDGTPINDISADSVKENDHLITDTLATIYLSQGNYAKAIFAYEKLCLKYPEKSTYFAGQIAEIKKLIERTK
jgi:hypothetical protein